MSARRLLLAAACALALGAAAAPAGAEEGRVLHVGLREDPDLLDPTLGSSYVGRIVYAAMCDKLFDINEKLEIVPQLATGYEYADPTHLTIHLRPGVGFHDGEKLDAEAVKFTLNRDLTAKGSMRVGEINAIRDIEVVDPLTVRLVLRAPSASLISQLADRAGIVMAPKAVEAAGDKFGLHPVCAGPFAFLERVAQDHITLRRFPGYWNAAEYHFDEVVYHPQPNAAVRLANLRAGAYDLVEQILPTDVPAVKRDPGLKLAIDDSLQYYGVTFNTGNGPAADTAAGRSALVRRAFELAIDRKALLDVVYEGLYAPTAQANPPSSPFFIASVQPPPRDVAGARALLKQAGAATPVPVTLTVANNPDLQQAAEVIQAMAAEAGFDVRIRVTEFASALQAAYAGDFQAYLIGWSGRSDPDGNTWQFLHTGGTFNYGHYSDPTMDGLLDRARETSDVAARRGFYAQVWDVQRRDMPLVYLWTPKNIVGMRRGLDGFRQVPDGLIRLQGVTLAR